jgi:SAM-dependent methyltransferase
MPHDSIGRKSLIDILACPRCRGELRRDGADLECAQGHRYEIRGGVPILFPDPPAGAIVHESELKTYEGYFLTIRDVIDAMTPDQVVVDLGAGNRDTPNTAIVRADVVLTPFVDVVADAHRLPFKDGTVDLVHGSAFVEHLRQPWIAAEEMLRVLKPGGHIYLECNFVYPFHGYPGMYFNASLDGMRSLFASFEEEWAVIAPWQMPSFAVSALLAEYLEFFRPETPIEREFVDALKALDRFPIRDFDARFSQEQAARIAAAVTFIGMKPLNGSPSLVPAPVLRRWESDPELRSRYPRPDMLMSAVQPDATPDALMIWARTTGSRLYPEIAACYDEARRFSRRL